MKKPFAFVGFIYLLTLFIASQISTTINLITAILAFLCGFIFLLLRKKSIPKVYTVASFTVAMAMSLYFASYNLSVKPKMITENTSTFITGVICELPYESHGKIHYVIETKDFGKIKLSTSKPIDCDVYDEISCNTQLFPIKGDGLFSKRTYYLAKKIFASGYILNPDDIIISEKKGFVNPYYFALKSRQAIAKSIRLLLPEKVSAVARGMLLGDKYDIDETISAEFRNLGISHLLAVSGLHMSVITASILYILKNLKLNKKISAIVASVGAFLFMAITGFSPSVIRAGIMSIIYLLSSVLMRKSDSINSLGFSLLIILLLNPFAVMDIGLLLSFFATLGILLFTRKFEQKFFYFLPHFLSSAFAVTLAASILTFPFIALSFKTFSIISFVANICIVLPSLVIIPTILLAAILYLISPIAFLGKIIAFLTGQLLIFILKLTSWLSSLPITTLSVGDGYIMFWIFGTLLLFAAAFFLNRKSETFKYTRITTLLSAILFLTGYFSYSVSTRDKISLSILSVDKGLSLVLTKNGRASILSCGGSKFKSNAINEYLYLNHIKSVDYMMLPSTNNENSLYADKILKEQHPTTVTFPKSDKFDTKITKSLLPKKGTCDFTKSLHVDIWQDVSIDAHVEKEKCAMKLTIYNITVLICPNKFDAKTLPNDYRNCDFFIVNSVARNCNKIHSIYSIISNDDTNLAKEVSRLCPNDDRLFVTGNDGDIIIDVYNDRTISIRH